jgi:hypothetical protein
MSEMFYDIECCKNLLRVIVVTSVEMTTIYADVSSHDDGKSFMRSEPNVISLFMSAIYERLQ